jgi:hypothetical protein
MTELAQMTMYCPDCGAERPFEQYHAETGCCPDSPDGQCPEWSCTACGAALFVSVIPYNDESCRVPDIRDRVA